MEGGEGGNREIKNGFIFVELCEKKRPIKRKHTHDNHIISHDGTRTIVFDTYDKRIRRVVCHG